MILSRKDLESEILLDTIDYKETALWLMKTCAPMVSCEGCAFKLGDYCQLKRGKECPGHDAHDAFRDWLEGGKDE